MVLFPKGFKSFKDLKKTSDKVPLGVLQVCGGNIGIQGLALDHPETKYIYKRVKHFNPKCSLLTLRDKVRYAEKS